MTEEQQGKLIQGMYLKYVARQGWVEVNVPKPESVAEHSWGTAMLVMMRTESEKALAQAILHDLAEWVMPDYTPLDNKCEKEKLEEEKLVYKSLLNPFPNSAYLFELTEDYMRRESDESRLVKECDLLDRHIQSELYQSEFPESNANELNCEEVEGLVTDFFKWLVGKKTALSQAGRFILDDRPETISSHSWGLSWLILALIPSELDLKKALKMALLHPFGKESRETILSASEPQIRANLGQICAEYDAHQGPESEFVRKMHEVEIGLEYPSAFLSLMTELRGGVSVDELLKKSTALF